MKLLLPGGSGQVGTLLARTFNEQGHEVVVLSRTPTSGQPWRTVQWDGQTVGDWANELEGADAVVNLAGRSVDCRYTAANRREIKQSRLDSTRAVGQAILQAKSPPPVWLQMSTATIYAHRFDAPNDEATGLIGGNEPGAPDTWTFSIDVATSWEAAAEAFDLPATRLVLLRTAMVMTPDPGGVFDTLLKLVRLGLGGSVAGGRQYVSWVHGEDFARAVQFIIDRPDLAGPVNLAAPNPLPYKDFMAALRSAWGTGLSRIGLPATAWMLEIAAFFLRTESELVLKSRRVVPGRLKAAGFAFEHPSWPEAARNLCGLTRDPTA